jgi:hypothetical protein
MEPSPRHRAAESRLRQLLTDSELPQPDDVEYTCGSVIFLWQEPKAAVFVDLDDPVDTCSTRCATVEETWVPESSERG